MPHQIFFNYSKLQTAGSVQCFHFVILGESDKSEALCALASGKGQRISARSFWNFPGLAAVGQNVPYTFLFPAPFCQTLRLFLCCCFLFLFFAFLSPAATE